MTEQALDESVYEPSEVEDIVREWFRTYSEKDFDAHNALIYPDAVVIYPEMALSIRTCPGAKRFSKRHWRRMGPISLT